MAAFTLSIIFFLNTFSMAARSPAPDRVANTAPWTKQALQLTGESENARQQALRALEKNKSLSSVLKKELYGRYRPLALDVIAALKRRDFVPELLKIAPSDGSGITYLTINVLMDAKNRSEILRHYKKQLFNPKNPIGEGPSQVILLESLGMLGEPLPVQSLLRLSVTTDWPEVQSSILTYARWMLFHERRPEYLALVKQGLGSEILQVREQAKFLFNELPTRTQKKFSAWLPPKSRSAQSDYLEKRDDLEIRVVFGYKDARPARFVGDRYEKLIVLNKLISPCKMEESFSCGFVRDAEDATILRRVFSTNRTETAVRLILISSSAGMDDDENRKDPYQRSLSELASKVFRVGLQKADAVFYIGHSRDGGGPSFEPPLLTKNNSVDYDRYSRERHAAQNMMATLQFAKRTQDHPLTLALLSCASRKHFLKDLQRVSPAIRTLTVAHLLYYSDALHHTLDQLSKLLKEYTNDFVLKSLHPTG